MLKKLLKNFRKESKASYDDSALMNTYTRLPVSFVRGEGSILWDDDGKRYLDAVGGLAVTILGHSHPKINECISIQASKLLHVSNLYQVQEQSRLAKKFCEISQMDKVFFANSGAEANEAAIKIARRYGHNKGIDEPTIITTKSSFHGRTMATLSATDNQKIQAGFTPLLSDFLQVEFNNIDKIGEHASNQNVVAVMVEPIQGEAGINVCDPGYLQSLRMLCDEHGWLLILDEIQTGMGRTGNWFAYQHEAILPDIMTSAKGLANGMPIGACAARGKTAEVLIPGSHGSTFGGNPLACQTALTTIDVIEQEQLIEAAKNTGVFLKKQITQTVGTHPRVSEIRGKGMMLAIELDRAYDNLAELFLQAGLLANITKKGKVIRLLPAINISQSEAKSIARIIHNVIIKLD